VTIVTLLGEGTFHQVHGHQRDPQCEDAFHAEYMNIRGDAFQPPAYQTLYFGSTAIRELASFGGSVRTRLLPM
jgi:hypothetical protein